MSDTSTIAFDRFLFRDDMLQAINLLHRESARLYLAQERVEEQVDQAKAEWTARMAQAERLRALPYGEYLKTAHWQKLRQAKLREADDRCSICNGRERLQVHHRTYEHLGNEAWDDLTVLCDGCHGTFHEHRSLAK